MIVCVFEHVRWRWALNGRPAPAAKEAVAGLPPLRVRSLLLRVAAGESVIAYKSPPNALEDTYDSVAVIEHVQMNIGT